MSSFTHKLLALSAISTFAFAQPSAKKAEDSAQPLAKKAMPPIESEMLDGMSMPPCKANPAPLWIVTPLVPAPFTPPKAPLFCSTNVPATTLTGPVR